MNYYILKGEEQRGPYTVDQMKHLWKTGQITIETPYWHDGMLNWMPLGVLVEDMISKEKFDKERSMKALQAATQQEVALKSQDKEPSTFENILIVVFSLFFSALAAIIGLVFILVGRRKSGIKLLVWGLLFTVALFATYMSGAFMR